MGRRRGLSRRRHILQLGSYKKDGDDDDDTFYEDVSTGGTPDLSRESSEAEDDNIGTPKRSEHHPTTTTGNVIHDIPAALNPLSSFLGSYGDSDEDENGIKGILKKTTHVVNPYRGQYEGPETILLPHVKQKVVEKSTTPAFERSEMEIDRPLDSNPAQTLDDKLADFLAEINSLEEVPKKNKDLEEEEKGNDEVEIETTEKSTEKSEIDKEPKIHLSWQEWKDNNTGYLYYWNTDTNIVQWEKPSAYRVYGSTDRVVIDGVEQALITDSKKYMKSNDEGKPTAPLVDKQESDLKIYGPCLPDNISFEERVKMSTDAGIESKRDFPEEETSLVDLTLISGVSELSDVTEKQVEHNNTDDSEIVMAVDCFEDDGKLSSCGFDDLDLIDQQLEEALIQKQLTMKTDLSIASQDSQIDETVSVTRSSVNVTSNTLISTTSVCEASETDTDTTEQSRCNDIDFDDVEEVDRALEMALEPTEAHLKEMGTNPTSTGSSETTVVTTDPPDSQVNETPVSVMVSQATIAMPGPHIQLMVDTATQYDPSETEMRIQKIEKLDVKEESMTSSEAVVASDDDGEMKCREDIVNVAAELRSKLEFLNVDKRNISPLQIMFIELQTRSSDWCDGSLHSFNLLEKLKEAMLRMEVFEKSAMPPGWHCVWERTLKRYYYVCTSSGQTVWHYPVNEEISTQPDPPGLGRESKKLQLSRIFSLASGIMQESSLAPQQNDMGTYQIQQGSCYQRNIDGSTIVQPSYISNTMDFTSVDAHNEPAPPGVAQENSGLGDKLTHEPEPKPPGVDVTTMKLNFASNRVATVIESTTTPTPGDPLVKVAVEPGPPGVEDTPNGAEPDQLSTQGETDGETMTERNVVTEIPPQPEINTDDISTTSTAMSTTTTESRENETTAVSQPIPQPKEEEDETTVLSEPFGIDRETPCVVNETEPLLVVISLGRQLVMYDDDDEDEDEPQPPGTEFQPPPLPPGPPPDDDYIIPPPLSNPPESKMADRDMDICNDPSTGLTLKSQPMEAMIAVHDSSLLVDAYNQSALACHQPYSHQTTVTHQQQMSFTDQYAMMSQYSYQVDPTGQYIPVISPYISTAPLNASSVVFASEPMLIKMTETTSKISSHKAKRSTENPSKYKTGHKLSKEESKLSSSKFGETRERTTSKDSSRKHHHSDRLKQTDSMTSEHSTSYKQQTTASGTKRKSTKKKKKKEKSSKKSKISKSLPSLVQKWQQIQEELADSSDSDDDAV